MRIRSRNSLAVLLLLVLAVGLAGAFYWREVSGVAKYNYLDWRIGRIPVAAEYKDVRAYCARLPFVQIRELSGGDLLVDLRLIERERPQFVDGTLHRWRLSFDRERHLVTVKLETKGWGAVQ